MLSKYGKAYFKKLTNHLKKDIKNTSFVAADSYVFTKCFPILEFDVLITKDTITLKYPLSNLGEDIASSITTLLNNSKFAKVNNICFVLHKHYTQPNKVYYFYWDVDISNLSFEQISVLYSNILKMKL